MSGLLSKFRENPVLNSILKDPVLRRELFVRTIIATQAREGIVTTVEQAESAYDKIQEEKCNVLSTL